MLVQVLYMYISDYEGNLQKKTRCTRGVRVGFSRSRMRSSNSARMHNA